MKSRLPLIPVFFALFFAVGFWVGCSVDFDSELPGVFSCTSDDDCTGRFVCVSGYCDEPPPSDNTSNGNGGGPTECIPGQIQGYPDSHMDDDDTYPLDIDEVCDGRDNNCDGEIDVIYCDDSGSCPSNPDDPNGVRLTFECNTDLNPPQCEAFAPNRFGGGECNQPIPCENGEYREVPNACGGNTSG